MLFLPYSYVSNNPLTLTDPSGLEGEDHDLEPGIVVTALWPAYAVAPDDFNWATFGNSLDFRFDLAASSTPDQSAKPHDDDSLGEIVVTTKNQKTEKEKPTDPAVLTENQSDQTGDSSGDAGAAATLGGNRKGERGKTGKPTGTQNAGKKFVQDKTTGRWYFKDPQTGKKILKPPGFVPPGSNGSIGPVICVVCAMMLEIQQSASPLPPPDA